ncbi:MAG: hypothetical protein AMXMBFR33_22310 [Candidatus Xenobia bacterium]
MSSVKGFFFDIGGVIVHADMDRWMLVGAGLLQSSPTAVRREVLALVPELERGKIDTQKFWKQVGENLWRAGQGRPPEGDECRWLWRDTMRATAKLDEDMLTFCWNLSKRGYTVAALSNTIIDHVKVLHDLGAYQPFRPCVLSCQVGLRKPEKEIYKLAAQLAKLKPKQCLLVDDREDNCEGARSAGWQAVLFSSPTQLLVDLRKMGLLKG